jgi:hypothetical protein
MKTNHPPIPAEGVKNFVCMECSYSAHTGYVAIDIRKEQPTIYQEHFIAISFNDVLARIHHPNN